MQQLIVIRGPSGSGKSSAARMIAASLNDSVICEADEFFMDPNGKYQFDPSKLKQAHEDCHRRIKKALDDGFNVICSNTSIKHWELNSILNLNTHKAKVTIYRCRGEFNNDHGVPQDKIDIMKRNYQPHPAEIDWKLH